jgi:hypothetical protein
MMAAWATWIHRNNIIFNNASMCLARWKHVLESYSFSASIEHSQVWSPLWVHGCLPCNFCKFVCFLYSFYFISFNKSTVGVPSPVSIKKILCILLSPCLGSFIVLNIRIPSLQHSSWLDLLGHFGLTLPLLIPLTI